MVPADGLKATISAQAEPALTMRSILQRIATARDFQAISRARSARRQRLVLDGLVDPVYRRASHDRAALKRKPTTRIAACSML